MKPTIFLLSIPAELAAISVIQTLGDPPSGLVSWLTIFAAVAGPVGAYFALKGDTKAHTAALAAGDERMAAIEKKIDSRTKEAGEQAERFTDALALVGKALEQVRSDVQVLRSEVSSAPDGGYAADIWRLRTNLEILRGEVSECRHGVNAVSAPLKVMGSYPGDIPEYRPFKVFADIKEVKRGEGWQ